jgi:hypothetical protein
MRDYVRSNHHAHAYGRVRSSRHVHAHAYGRVRSSRHAHVRAYVHVPSSLKPPALYLRKISNSNFLICPLKTEKM